MNKKLIISIAGVVAIIGIVAGVINIATPKSYVIFASAPKNINVIIDDGKQQSVENGKKVRVSPGTHTVAVTQTDFTPYTKEISIKNNETLEFLVALSPQTDAARSLIEDDISQAIIQRFYGKTYTKQTDEITNNYPILSELPIEARFYTIAACGSERYPEDATKIALCVGLYQANLEPYVLKDISSRGYDPNDYEIIWDEIYKSD